MRPSGTVTEIWRLKDNGVTSLTFWGHVTSSVTWPFDSRASTSSPWSMVTMAPLRRYGASNIGRTNLDTERKTGEWKEKEKEGGKGKVEKKWKGKGKGKARWMKNSLRNVGRTDAHTDAPAQSWFYTLSNAMHCIGQTKTIKRHFLAQNRVIWRIKRKNRSNGLACRQV